MAKKEEKRFVKMCKEVLGEEGTLRCSVVVVTVLVEAIVFRKGSKVLNYCPTTF